MPRRNPICQRCGRRPTYDQLDAWVVIERAPNTLPLMYQRRWCTMCITPDERTIRAELLDRRERQRRARVARQQQQQRITEGQAGRTPETRVSNAPEELLGIPDGILAISERRFGVECEFLGDVSLVEHNVGVAGELCRRMSYNHATQPHWKIVLDSSIRGPGGELVSPILSGAVGLTRLQRACQGLAAAGARNDRSTGLHIHHEIHELGDQRRQVIQNTLLLYAAHQHLIDAMLAPSRRGNHFCRGRTIQEITSTLVGVDSEAERGYRSWEQCLNVYCGDRYTTVNTLALERYGTLEFRQHQGTVSYERISAWIRFGQALIALAGRITEDEAQLVSGSHDSFFARLELPDQDRRYWRGRVRFFAEGPRQGRRTQTEYERTVLTINV